MKSGFWARGGGWVIGQSVLMASVALVSVVCRSDWHRPARAVAGSLLLVIGAAYGLGGVVALGRNRTMFPSPQMGAVFVERGIYRFVRHPLYASVVFVSAGWALLWGSDAGLGLTVLMGLFLRQKAKREEHWLQKHFPEYESYRQRVKSVVPWLL